MSHDVLSLSRSPPLQGELSDEHLITVITEEGLRNVEAAELKTQLTRDIDSRLTTVENQLADLGNGVGGGGGRLLGKVKYVVTQNQPPEGELYLPDFGVTVPPGTYVLLAEQEHTPHNGIWIVAADDWRPAFATYQPYDWVIVETFEVLDADQSTEIVGQKWVNRSSEEAPHGSGIDQWTQMDAGFSTAPYASRVHANQFDGQAEFRNQVSLTRTEQRGSLSPNVLVFNNEGPQLGGNEPTVAGIQAFSDYDLEEGTGETAGAIKIKSVETTETRPHTEIEFSTAYGGYGEGVRWRIDPVGNLVPRIHPEYGSGSVGTIDNYTTATYTEIVYLRDTIVSQGRLSFRDEVGNHQSISVDGVDVYENVRFKLDGAGVKFFDSEQARIYGGYATSQITFEGDNGSIANVYYQSSENETDGHVFEAGGDQVFGIYKDRLYSTVEIVAPSFNGIATSAERLATPVRINGQEFDGTQDIEIDVGSAGTFEFTQEEPSSTWIIEHNLGFRPNVITMDSDYGRIEGYVRNPTVNRTEITYSEPVSGYATLS